MVSQDLTAQHCDGIINCMLYLRRFHFWIAICSMFSGIAASALPVMEDFESLQPGSLHGQSGWILEAGGPATVQTNLVHSGDQALFLRSATVSRSVESDRSTMWARFHAYISEAPTALPQIDDPNTSVAFYINMERQFVVMDGTNQVVTSGPVMPLNEWVQIDVFCDFENLRWLLGVNGETIAHNLSLFSSDENQRIQAMAFQNGASDFFVDDVSLFDFEPPHAADLDADGDGLPDWWEQRYFGGITSTSPEDDAASGASVLDTYVAGLHPGRADARFAAAIEPGRGLNWDRQPGRVYDIYWSDDLTDPERWLRIVEDYPESDFQDDDPDRMEHGTGFYRLRVRRP